MEHINNAWAKVKAHPKIAAAVAVVIVVIIIAA
jgi:flagellar biosynthesis/type III secretory pathway M-ring protein FliF/YscJ